MLLKALQGSRVIEAELARRFSVDRGTIHNWVRSGQLERDMAAGEARYTPRPPVTHIHNNHRLRAAMRSSRLPAVKTLAQFEFAFQPSLTLRPAFLVRSR